MKPDPIALSSICKAEWAAHHAFRFLFVFVMLITDGLADACDCIPEHGGKVMASPPLFTAVTKLAIAGEQAGFTIDKMVQLLNDGLTIESLLDLIESSLRRQEQPAVSPAGSSRWVT